MSSNLSSPTSPLVVVNQLSKRFHQHNVVHQLSFQVAPGQIWGFLGPNGAGKSTTMKMLTGYLRPSEGSIEVCGYDVGQQPRQAQKHIGYLPEHNPLYLEMYVHEYLQFMGSIRGLKRTQCWTRTQEVVERCGITEMQNKKIKALSKGYRQRVGLAQALIHDPAVLILDEPTTGLDPNQLHELRTLIKAISYDKAVILSTHIMQEVEALCDQVLLINHGQVLIHGPLAQLITSSHVHLLIEFRESAPLAALEQLAGVQQVTVVSDGKYVVHARHGIAMRESLFRFAQEQNLTLLGLEEQKRSLETIFQELTQKQ
ncbi:MAG: ATP-binding cassette domain-containing protein [Roseivirga sp.]